jgi:hypothetical protein
MASTGHCAQISILSALICRSVLQTFFGTGAIGLTGWGALLVLLAFIVVLAEEIRKWLAEE